MCCSCTDSWGFLYFVFSWAMKGEFNSNPWSVQKQSSFFGILAVVLAAQKLHTFPLSIIGCKHFCDCTPCCHLAFIFHLLLWRGASHSCARLFEKGLSNWTPVLRCYLEQYISLCTNFKKQVHAWFISLLIQGFVEHALFLLLLMCAIEQSIAMD